MKFILLPVLFLLSVFLEATIIQLPLTLLLLLAVTILYQSEWVFFAAVFLGVLLDSLLFRSLGSTGLFFLLFLLFVFLYERKFELKTVQFAALISLLGSFLYLIIFGHSILWMQILLSVVLGIGFFFILQISYIKKYSSKEHFL